MKTAGERILVALCVAAHAGCASVTTLVHPATEVKLTGAPPENRVQQVWFSPLGFFERSSTDPVKVCPTKRWRAEVDSQGNATFEARTESHFVNFLSPDSADAALESMGRHLALCAERLDGKVEHLISLDSFDAMLMSGATLRVECRLSSAQWHCSSSVID